MGLGAWRSYSECVSRQPKAAALTAGGPGSNIHDVPDPSFPDPAAPEANLETREAPDPCALADPVLAQLIDLVARRAVELKSISESGTSGVDLGRLREAIAALDGYRAGVAFAKGAARELVAATPAPPEPESPSPPTPDVETETWSHGVELLEPVIGATHEPNGGSPAPDAERDYPPFRDQVTGLHSREGFDAVASGELKRCRRYGRVFSLVLLQLPDADPEGLRRAANAVNAAIRESDLAGRQLDRTLAVALPEAPPNEARIVAERIIGHCEGVGVWDLASRVALVTHPAHGETLAHLLDAARTQLMQPGRQVLSTPDRGPWPDA